jgi:hypothetical protein
MPRPRDIVGLKTTAKERRAAVLRKAVETYQPYRVFKQDKTNGFKRKGWCLVYVNPTDLSREMVMSDITEKTTAVDLRELLEQAWARGALSRIE